MIPNNRWENEDRAALENVLRICSRCGNDLDARRQHDSRYTPEQWEAATERAAGELYDGIGWEATKQSARRALYAAFPHLAPEDR